MQPCNITYAGTLHGRPWYSDGTTMKNCTQTLIHFILTSGFRTTLLTHEIALVLMSGMLWKKYFFP